jgi:hypothetical protein
MELKFVATAKPKQINAAVQRRQKLIGRIDQQVGYVRQMIEGKQAHISCPSNTVVRRWS